MAVNRLESKLRITGIAIASKKKTMIQGKQRFGLGDAEKFLLVTIHLTSQEIHSTYREKRKNKNNFITIYSWTDYLKSMFGNEIE